jgi:hypothetical protein
VVHFGLVQNHGGDPVLFQHLFCLYSHPAGYIMSLILILTGSVVALEAQTFKLSDGLNGTIPAPLSAVFAFATR